MDELRSKLRDLLSKDLFIEFKSHDALSNLDTFGASVKIVNVKIDEVVNKIIELFEKR